MPDVSDCLFQSWMHSFEEDQGNIRVFRPTNFSFPLSRRPRLGLEIRADGTFIELRPGPADKPERFEGRWQAVSSAQLRATFAGGSGDRTLEVVHCDSNVLKLREG
jgi:hypothetical protein